MVQYEMHLDHMHGINYTIVHNMDEQLFCKIRLENLGEILTIISE